MDKSTTVTIDAGEFTISNRDFTIGEEIALASQREQIANGAYGQMTASENVKQLMAGIAVFRICELNARIEKSPDGFNTCADLSAEELAKLWDGWTEKSGMFPTGETEPSGEPEGGTGPDSGGD